jgi:hypothetical protein
MAGEWCLFPLFCGPVFYEEPTYYRRDVQDNYCARYERTVLNRRELTALMNLPERMRNRIRTNELDYACNCLGWRNSECRRVRITGWDYNGNGRRRY